MGPPDEQLLEVREIRAQLGQEIAERTLRDDLLHLKRLGLVGSKSHGREAVCFVQKRLPATIGRNKAE